METGMLHLHKLAVTLFVLLHLIKASLAIFKKYQSYERVAKTTRIPGMVISVIFLLTGIYLTFKLESIDVWMIVKLVAIVVAIPVAIVASKKQNQFLELIAFILLLYVYAVAETRSPILIKSYSSALITEPNAVGYDVLKHGAAVYDMQCRRCHGEDGTLSKMNATNLSLSDLSVEENAMMIKNGSTLMPAFVHKLNQTEIDAVAQYVQTLKK